MKNVTIIILCFLNFCASAQIDKTKTLVKPTNGVNVNNSVLIDKKNKKPLVHSAVVKVKPTLQITSHSDGQNIGIMTQILGTGEPGLQIKVGLYAFSEVTPKKQSPWETFKMITLPTSTYSEVKKILTQKTGTTIKERTLKTYDVTIDENGKWYIPPFASFGDPNWVRQAFIPFAWVVVATVENPNYKEGNYVNIRLGVKY